jgi:hypothetical protein
MMSTPAVRQPRTAPPTPASVARRRSALRMPPRTEREQARDEMLRRLRAARAAFARLHRSP